MKIADIRALSEEELVATLDDLHEEWRDLRFKFVVGQLQDTKRIWQIRRTIARIKTVQTERQMEEQIAQRIGSAS